MTDWPYEVIARKNGQVVLHTRHKTEHSRDLEIECFKERKDGSVTEVMVIDNTKPQKTMVYL